MNQSPSKSANHNSTPIPRSFRDDDPIVLCAADENYVRPLAVTLHSAATSLGVGRRLQVLLLDGGLSQSSWQGLQKTLADLPISIHVIEPNRAEVADLAISHHITHTAYYRLLAARLLPSSIDKVIYLDADVLVRDDLSELWKLNVEPDFCLAAVDVACPFLDARYADAKFQRAIPYLAAISPVRNWRSLGLDPRQPYFNSGVMVLNLKRWRESEVDRDLLGCLRNHRKYVWCWDQYALNVVFAGKWRALPGRWNQGAHVFEYPDESAVPMELAEFRSMRDDPALIHYTSEFKPWLYRPYHPQRGLWYDRLDQTAWANWRPPRPPFRVRDWWNRQAVGWSRRFIVSYRKMGVTFFPNRALPGFNTQ